MARSKFLQRQTVPIKVTDRSVSELTDAMALTGFQGRKLGESVQTWAEMLKQDRLTIMMGYTGALSPAGMRKIIAYMIQHRMIDCLVSSGANMFHDVFESTGGSHYVGSHVANDEALFKEGVDRIYDVFAVEKEFRGTDFMVMDFAMKNLEPGKSYSFQGILLPAGQAHRREHGCRRGRHRGQRLQAQRAHLRAGTRRQLHRHRAHGRPPVQATRSTSTR